MTTRGQNLRSSTPGQIPAAGTRQPGEIWMNFPDKQLGVIDTTKTAQKMLAVRFFSTSASYVAGEFVVQAGGVWVAKGAVPAGAFTPSQWNELAYLTDIPALYVLPVATTTTLGGVKPDGVTVQADVNGVLTSVGLVAVGTAPPTPVQPGALWYDLISGQLYVYANDGTSNQWVIAVNQNIGGGVFLPMTGGTLTGPLTLSGDPTTPLMAATKQYVDGGGGYSHENRIINGDMRIDQRNNGANTTPTTPVYVIDRWKASITQASKINFNRATNGPGMTSNGWPYSLYCSTTSAYTPIATDAAVIVQAIEAEMISDFGWGSSNAQPVTLSFWMLASVAGTYSGSIRNGDVTRSYPFSFNISTASTWSKYIITIPGDTAGTWSLSGNGTGVSVAFDLGSGANFRGPAGAWASANYSGVTGTVSMVATAGALIYITGVKLETGNIATPYNRQSLTKSMADCQRYYCNSGGNPYVFIYGGAGNNGGCVASLPVTMRAIPTVVMTRTGLINMTSFSAPVIGLNSFADFGVLTAAGAGQWRSAWTAEAEL